MAELNRPGPDKSLCKLWDDENRGGSIRFQNFALKGFRKAARAQFTKKCGEIENLQERVRELKLMVIDSNMPHPVEKDGMQTENSEIANPSVREQKVTTKIEDVPLTLTEVPANDSKQKVTVKTENDPPTLTEHQFFIPAYTALSSFIIGL
ncbi:hypothetical protein C8R48DRAFT_779450 [Suillus tomentosus]|nr:hypothetical protein C8R48DRAFT_779450 [Suillus tomentosus]